MLVILETQFIMFDSSKYGLCILYPPPPPPRCIPSQNIPDTIVIFTATLNTSGDPKPIQHIYHPGWSTLHTFALQILSSQNPF
jgi:hypothetical protein